MTELGHLLTADEVLTRLGWAQELHPAFYLGAIAPDAHRATIGVDYRDLHFRSSHTSGRRLIDFLREYLRPALSGSDAFAQAFFTGWFTHISADFVWRQHLRHDLNHVWRQITDRGSMESVSLREEFYEECDWTDQRLYEQHNQRTEDIRWMLQHAHAGYTVQPLRISDINHWRQQVLLEMMPPPRPNVDKAHLLGGQFVTRCIAEAAEEALAVFEMQVQRISSLEYTSAPA